MIETPEEFERAMYVARMSGGPTLRKAMKTLLATRKVIRKADNLDECSCDTCQVFWRLRESLPKWIRGGRR